MKNERVLRSAPKHADSAAKVVEDLEKLQPLENPIHLRASSFRVLHCKQGCAWCCLRFTLDYIPEELPLLPEAIRARFRPREVRGKRIWTLDQHRMEKCPFLKEQGWGCQLYPNAPISCMMAPQIHISLDKGVNAVTIYSKRFSRPTHQGFAPCEFRVHESEEELRREMGRNVVMWNRLLSWARYFGLETVIPDIVKLLENPLTPRRTLEVYSGAGGMWGLLK